MAQAVVHFEIIGADPATLRHYYAELFGWEFAVGDAATELVSEPGNYGFVDGRATGDGIGINGGVGGGPGFERRVLFYVGVPDVEAALRRAESLGGSRRFGPETDPGGAYAVGAFTDPEGNVVGVAGPPGRPSADDTVATTIDAVTGARVEVTLLVDLPRERLWALATDVSRYGEWSPECEYAGWLDDAQGRSPRVGDRFAGRNRFGEEFVTSVVCEVTELRAPETFEWAVLDERGERASVWRYELSDGDRADRTRLRHSFEHGPGETMTRIMAADDPGALDRRLAELRGNIVLSLATMLDGVRHEEVPA